jgi:hypothetical protein
MALPSPNLDDRSWDQLVRDAKERITQVSPEWTDLSPGDPGMTLVEVFAYLTETLIYRLNRVPEKLFIEFLRLIGIHLRPQSAAATTLVFKRKGVEGPIEIPRATRVTVAQPTPGREPPVFVTADAARIPDGADEVQIKAYHVELVEAEPAGPATGRAGYKFTVRRPPIVETAGPLDLVVAVEAAPGELKEGDPALEHGGRSYRIWREVEYFTDEGLDGYIYVADRGTGLISFAPEARMLNAKGDLEDTPRPLAAIPAAERRILVWYPRGGGSDGNVAAGTLTTLKDPVRGVEVTNSEPGSGGRSAESLDNALIRGPQEFHTLRRAVTARDFEFVAQRATPAIARAIAVTQAELWRYATAGTVEVHVVPTLSEGADPTDATAEQLTGLQTTTALETVRARIDEQRPLGTRPVVSWARYKTVRVKAELVVHREEDAGEVQRRVDRRLHQTVNPLPTELNAAGWPFGGTLYASSAHKIILSEPGVRYARNVRLMIDAAPEVDVPTLAVDPFQTRTWYGGSRDMLFRSLNDGLGWEAMARMQGETIHRIRPHPSRPGLIALATHLADRGSRIYVSWDCGNTWTGGGQLGMTVEDIAWIERAGVPKILIATNSGLYEKLTDPDADLERGTLVDTSNSGLGFYAVAVSREVSGQVSVAVAAQEVRGVWLSSEAGQSGTFRMIGLAGKDIKTLEIQQQGPDQYLWAGVSSPGDTPGEGCHSWQLLGREDPKDGWRAWTKGWQGGSCRSVTFLDKERGGPGKETKDIVLAATWWAGVLRLDTSAAQPAWQPPDVRAGLEPRDLGRFAPALSVASDPGRNVVMASGAWGIRRSLDRGRTYDNVAESEFEHEVTIPRTWVLVNGQNEIKVTRDA